MEPKSWDESQSGSGTDTFFAPAGRAGSSVLDDEFRIVANDPLLRAVEAAIDGYLLILNRERQILAANQQFLRDLGVASVDRIVGNRPGEILECIHASQGPNGCGTSKACSACGAVLTVLASQRDGKPAVGECFLTVRSGEYTESMEFRVRATPVRINEHEFTVVVLNDISSEKRRDALEHIFFHDILNTVGGLVGWSSMLESEDDEDQRLAASKIMLLAERLTRDIKDQRQLLQAEKGDLHLSVDHVPVVQILEGVRSIFSVHESAKDRKIEFGSGGVQDEIRTDSSLLVRVLSNMLKNALEAVKQGETVRVWYERREGEPVFLVWNPGVIPEPAALRIFQRSFSTKGSKGRGLGTYSMKLFGERYLRGQVGFESTAAKGTTFFIRLPREAAGGESGSARR